MKCEAFPIEDFIKQLPPNIQLDSSGLTEQKVVETLRVDGIELRYGTLRIAVTRAGLAKVRKIISEDYPMKAERRYARQCVVAAIEAYRRKADAGTDIKADRDEFAYDMQFLYLLDHWHETDPGEDPSRCEVYPIEEYLKKMSGDVLNSQSGMTDEMLDRFRAEGIALRWRDVNVSVSKADLAGMREIIAADHPSQARREEVRRRMVTALHEYRAKLEADTDMEDDRDDLISSMLILYVLDHWHDA
jgi:hypothetical protein